MALTQQFSDEVAPDNLFLFEPNTDRAAFLDHRMRSELADSLAHVAEQCAPAIDFDGAAIADLISGLREGRRYPPSTFGLYYGLVSSVLDEDLESAKRNFDLLAQEKPLPGGLTILAMDPPGANWRSDLYRQLMDSDARTVFDFLPPSDDEFASFKSRFESGYKRLRAVIPELAGEVDAIVSEVVVAVGKSTSEYVFDGGSAFTLWGGLFLNARFHKTDMEVIEVIAHETAHSFLFGFCINEPLVNNPDEDLFPSPLRADDRPMDGIYHATFVSARMCWAMSRLLAAGGLSPEDYEATEKAILHDKRNFESGYSVVEEHGDLTQTGKALMDAAARYMKTV